MEKVFAGGAIVGLLMMVPSGATMLVDSTLSRHALAAISFGAGVAYMVLFQLVLWMSREISARRDSGSRAKR